MTGQTMRHLGERLRLCVVVQGDWQREKAVVVAVRIGLVPSRGTFEPQLS